MRCNQSQRSNKGEPESIWSEMNPKPEFQNFLKKVL